MEQTVRENVITFTLMSFAALAVLTFASIYIREKAENVKYFLFGTFTLVVLANTLYLVGSTLYLNINSITGGPVHYHADFQIWDCGKKVDFMPDPKGFSNKVGTPVLHEHNDNRIHVEGVVLDNKDITLGAFFNVTGWEFSNTSFKNTSGEGGMFNRSNGDLCNMVPGQLQVFAYKTVKNVFYQEKLVNPADYILSSHSKIPPGDCIIVEFDLPKDRTDKICDFYQVAIQKGEINAR